MNSININKNQFSDLLNILNKVFFPLKNFVNEIEFNSIINKKKIGNSFFPFPIFFGVNKKTYLKIKNKKNINLLYRNKYLINIYKIKFYDINKYKFLKKIYGKNYLKHPYTKKFIDENFKFLSFEFKNPHKKNLKNKYFVSPKKFNKMFNIKKLKNLASFHTRNVPHNAHQWIHNYLFNKYGSLLIQPLIGQYRKDEYSDELIMKTNKLASKMFKSKKVFSIPFFSYPRYAGYREAALHALVRKNYGCTHFWIGRDHAGYKNFFGYNKSQVYCKKNEAKLKIRIIAGKEPFYCKSSKKIINDMKLCSSKNILKISGSKIRQILRKNKSIPHYLMSPQISKYLSKKSLLK